MFRLSNFNAFNSSQTYLSNGVLRYDWSKPSNKYVPIIILYNYYNIIDNYNIIAV